MEVSVASAIGFRYRPLPSKCYRTIWKIAPESAKGIGHPAPFPIELPRRLIQLYSYSGDVILDPFAGSGTTGVAAIQNGRRFIGYDTDAGYVAAANRRLEESAN